MFRDNDLVLADGQRIETNVKGANTFDGKVANMLGIGNPLYIIAVVTAASAAATGMIINVRSNAADGAGVAVGAPIAPQLQFGQAEVRRVGSRKVSLIEPDSNVLRYVHAQIQAAAAAGANEPGRVAIWISHTTEGYQYIRSGYRVA